MVRKLFLRIKRKSKRLSDIVSITDPQAFAGSIAELKKGGLTRRKKQALVFAQNTARAQLKRKNLSPKEVREFSIIANMKLPPISKEFRRLL